MNKPFTLGIPASFLAGGRWSPGPVRMREDIAAWCETELQRPYSVRFETFAFRVNMFMPYEITFGNDLDLIHFKLMWV